MTVAAVEAAGPVLVEAEERVCIRVEARAGVGVVGLVSTRVGDAVEGWVVAEGAAGAEAPGESRAALAAAVVAEGPGGCRGAVVGVSGLVSG